jgi:hypothetical protein
MNLSEEHVLPSPMQCRTRGTAARSWSRGIGFEDPAGEGGFGGSTMLAALGVAAEFRDFVATTLGDRARVSFDEALEGRSDALVHGRFGDRAWTKER